MDWIDPDNLPETAGTIAVLLYNEHGVLDGVVLDGRRQIHIPPHLGARLQRQLKVGEHVTVRGIKPRHVDLIAAVSVGTPDGRQFIDEGPAQSKALPPSPASKTVHFADRVSMTLFAPRGEVSGALLEGGQIVRLQPKGNQGIAPYLRTGRQIEIWGQGFRKAGTQVVQLEHIAPR